jgi:hypothetical protein
MIRSLYVAARERRWNRDRSRRIAEMLQRERSVLAANNDWLVAMAIQLAEIRALPEALEPQVKRPFAGTRPGPDPADRKRPQIHSLNLDRRKTL